MTSRAIATIALDEPGAAQAAVTRPFLDLYAERVGADIVDGRFHDHPEITKRFTQIQLSKLDTMREALEQYDRVLWLDVDVMVRPDAPDIFEVIPDNKWAGREEIAIFMAQNKFWRYEQIIEHMETVCRQEGIGPLNRNRAIYFNCGVQLAAKQHAFLYAPAKNPDDWDWAEQTRVSVRVCLAADAGRLEVYYLPDAFNSMKYAGELNYGRTCWFNHYCGMQGADRLIHMQMDAEVWRKRYGRPNNDQRLRAG